MRVVQRPGSGTDLVNDQRAAVIILLDLNYTLVGNSVERRTVRPWRAKIEGEKYRRELVELLQAGDHYVIMLTARPDYQREFTMDNIRGELSGWQPHEAWFNTRDFAPHVWKEHALQEHIFPKHGDDGSRYFAFESNPKTHAMHARYGIASARMVDGSAPATPKDAQTELI